MSDTALVKKQRVVGFDVARCLAILSMVYVNFEVVIAPGARTPTWLHTIANAFEGNASALFVTLAGVGLVLLGRRGTILKRALLLLVVGYLWQLLWPGDILHYYAFYLAVGAICLNLRARTLWVLAAVSVAGWLGLHQFLDYGAGWRWLDLSYPDFWTPTGQLRNLFFNGWHPLFPWLAFLFLGMAVGRWDIAAKSKRRIALVAAPLSYVTALFLSQWLGALPDERSIGEQFTRWFQAPEYLWGMNSIPPGPLYVLSAGSVAIFVIALCLELTSLPIIQKITRPLTLCGQLALTHYLGHVLVLFFVVVPVQESVEADPLVVAAAAAAAYGIAAILFSTLWRRRFRRGPLEWTMRRLCG